MTVTKVECPVEALSPPPPINLSRVKLRTRTAVLVAFLLAALGLAACGGSGSSPTGSTAETAPGAAKEGGASKPTGSGSKSSNGKQSNGSGKSASGSGGSSPAHNDSGGGAAQFKTKGGDNSIQEFGGEGGGSELAQAAAALHGFLDARATGDWKRACANMAAGVTKSLEQLAGAAHSLPGKKGKNAPKHIGCPQLLAAMSTGMPAYVKRDLAKADVGALRVEGERAFLLFRGAHHTNYFMPMAREAGKWKVAAIAASALP